MRARTDRAPWRVWLGALLLLLPLVALGVRSLAAALPQVVNPHGSFREACADCHSAQGWKPAHVTAKFDHARYGFRLDGAHAAASCLTCHTSLKFSQANTQCVSCHQDPHRGEMGTDCARCHGSRSFIDRGPMVRAHQLTRFPLTGSHAALDCESCHKPAAQGQMQFVHTSTACADCHLPQFQAAKNPDHVAGGFPTDCSQCHSSLVWSTSRFDHDRTAFPLTGAHRATACAACHTTGKFAALSTACESCHMTQFASATPPHAAAGFPPGLCATCHTTTQWAGATFDHNTQTTFPLTGAHIARACTDCHGDGVYKGKATDCASCHITTYAAATPNHVAASFPAASCANCHNTTQWAGASFNHNTQTSFALTGAHIGRACTDCHGDGVFKGKPTDCASCHLVTYNAATPNHPAAGFPASACATCHNTTQWAGATFDHNTQTTFPLTGSHIGGPCSECHGDGVYKGKSTACIACHQTNYNLASPNHTSAGFLATACASCHNTTAWNPGAFDHTAQTTFPLTGAHIGRACSDCHGDNVFKGKPTDCASCHIATYNTATPNHVAANFPAAQCATCHNTTQWAGATFDHDASWFPIYSGTHKGRWSACSDCHAVSTDFSQFTCLSCHPHDNKAQTDGNHNGVRSYTYDSPSCYRCHPTGRSG